MLFSFFLSSARLTPVILEDVINDPIHFTVTKVDFIADCSPGFNTFKIMYHEMISADLVDLSADYPIHEWS